MSNRILDPRAAIREMVRIYQRKLRLAHQTYFDGETLRDADTKRPRPDPRWDNRVPANRQNWMD